MDDLPDSRLAERIEALHVARGITRLFARNDIWCLSEMPRSSLAIVCAATGAAPI